MQNLLLLQFLMKEITCVFFLVCLVNACDFSFEVRKRHSVCEKDVGHKARKFPLIFGMKPYPNTVALAKRVILVCYQV